MNLRSRQNARRLLIGLMAFVVLVGYITGLRVFAEEAAPAASGSVNITIQDPGEGEQGPEEDETPPADTGSVSITIQNPGEGGEELGEETTPLAGPAGHSCCALHFLLMLAALLLELLCISSDKKGQQKVFAARTRLEEYNAGGWV